METLRVGRLALFFFFVAFAVFPKHQCGREHEHDDDGDNIGGSMVKRAMKMMWDGEQEKINLDFCKERKCKQGQTCWCCMKPGQFDCYDNRDDCEFFCPAPPPAPNHSSPSP